MIKFKLPKISNIKVSSEAYFTLAIICLISAFLFGWIAFPVVFLVLFVSYALLEGLSDKRLDDGTVFPIVFIYILIGIGGCVVLFTALTTDHREIVYINNKPYRVTYQYTSDGTDPATFDCDGLLANKWINPFTKCAVFSYNYVSFDIKNNCVLCVGNDCKNVTDLGNKDFAARINTKNHRLICDNKQLYPTDFSQYIEVQ